MPATESSVQESELKPVFPVHNGNKGEAILGYVLLGIILPLLTAYMAWSLGMPQPRVHDEFSYLFMADTFALGRLTNPAHPLAEFFQTFHIIHHEGVYASKYFPGLGLQLLAGKILGHPMIGVWVTIGLFGVSLLFVLRQFFHSRVALIVSLLCSMRFMVLTYFGHSYWGGSLMALAGVWILGGAVLAAKTGLVRYSWLSAAGMVLCILTRPFEGMFFMFPLACWQIYGLLRSNRSSEWHWNLRLIMPMAFGMGLGVLMIGVYNQQITGKWTVFPHSKYERSYTPHGVRFLWDNKKNDLGSFADSLPQPFHAVRESYFMTHQKRTEDYFGQKLLAASNAIPFLLPISLSWLVIAAFAFKKNWKNWMWQLCVLTGLIRLVPFILSWSSAYPHYSAPWIFPLALVSACGLQSLLAWERTRIFGRVACALTLSGLAVIYVLGFSHRVDLDWKDSTSYPSHELDRKAAVQNLLAISGSRHLVFVQYSAHHNFHSEWIYNGPEIDDQKIIWAHDLGWERNFRLINYYEEKQVWRVKVGSRTILERWNKPESKFEFVRSV